MIDQRTGPLVSLTGVSRRFGEVLAVSEVDLVVHPGEYVAVTGYSGSGKSTLLNLIGLLDRPTTGAVQVGGVDTKSFTDDQRSALRGRSIGFVFQGFHLLQNRTARENVELGMLYRGLPYPERRRRAEVALEQVGLAHRMNAYPSTMSGGECQRVAIARALAAEVALLLADEPTGNLDAATSERVLRLFDELHIGGLSLIVVTHNPEVADRAQRHLVMVDGSLSE